MTTYTYNDPKAYNYETSTSDTTNFETYNVTYYYSCPKCGHTNSNNARFCNECGTKLITEPFKLKEPPHFRDIDTADQKRYSEIQSFTLKQHDCHACCEQCKFRDLYNEIHKKCIKYKYLIPKSAMDIKICDSFEYEDDPPITCPNCQYHVFPQLEAIEKDKLDDVPSVKEICPICEYVIQTREIEHTHSLGEKVDEWAEQLKDWKNETTSLNYRIREWLTKRVPIMFLHALGIWSLLTIYNQL